jgi:hypothetical protein
MNKNPLWLLDYKRNIFSQTGEDGIIEKILEIIPDKDYWCVEFGAWDGIMNSNTRNLIINFGYSAVLIESSKKKFDELKKNYSNTSRVIPLNKFVGFSENDNLDKILEKTPIPQNYDFLCIDIDGNDYHIWNAIKTYKPKLVCIEFNPTIPNEIEFVQQADFKINQGSSLLSIIGLARSKGYQLISIIDFNAFFVDEKYFDLFEISDNSLQTMRRNSSYITYFFTGYDGTIFLDGSQRYFNHGGIKINSKRLQYIPKFLRKYSGNYNLLEKILFALWILYKDPKTFISLLKVHLKNYSSTKRG